MPSIAAKLRVLPKRAQLLLLGIAGLLASGMLAVATSSQDEWTRRELRATDGTEIVIAYQVDREAKAASAEPVWIQVSNPRLSGTENVQALLQNYFLMRPGYPEQQQMAVGLPLVYDSGEADGTELSKFTVSLGGFPIWSIRENGSEQRFRQELVVTVDGRALTNAEDGKAVFSLQLER